MPSISVPATIYEPDVKRPPLPPIKDTEDYVPAKAPNGNVLDAMRIDTLRTRAKHLRHLAGQQRDDLKIRARLEGRAEAFETLAADMEAGTW